MSNDEDVVERRIQELGLNAPRITPERIDEVIRDCQYWIVPGTTTTVCAMRLINGFVVVGHSACASRANFNPALGEEIAYRHAREQVWALEGYALRCMLAADPEAPALRIVE